MLEQRPTLTPTESITVAAGGLEALSISYWWESNYLIWALSPMPRLPQGVMSNIPHPPLHHHTATIRLHKCSTSLADKLFTTSPPLISATENYEKSKQYPWILISFCQISKQFSLCWEQVRRYYLFSGQCKCTYFLTDSKWKIYHLWVMVCQFSKQSLSRINHNPQKRLVLP